MPCPYIATSRSTPTQGDSFSCSTPQRVSRKLNSSKRSHRAPWPLLLLTAYALPRSPSWRLTAESIPESVPFIEANTARGFLNFPRVKSGRWSEALPGCGLEGKPTGGGGWCAAGCLFSDDSQGKWTGGMGHVKGAGAVGTVGGPFETSVKGGKWEGAECGIFRKRRKAGLRVTGHRSNRSRGERSHACYWKGKHNSSRAS